MADKGGFYFSEEFGFNPNIKKSPDTKKGEDKNGKEKNSDKKQKNKGNGKNLS
jgi:hypothetical protein